MTSLFYKLFYYLEHNDLLDPIDEVHLFAIHYIFLPRINKSLGLFQEAWNFHGLRTERGKTPSQLFIGGALNLRHSGLTALDLFEPVAEDYGVVEDGGAPDDIDGVSVPRVAITLTEDQLSELCETVNPLDESSDYGISLYIQTVQVLRSWNIS